MEDVIGYVNIRITDSDVVWDTELPLPELIFWLETVKSMVIRTVIDNELEDQA